MKIWHFRGISPYDQIQKMARMYDSRVSRILLHLWIAATKYILGQPNTRNVPVLSLTKSIVEAANYQFDRVSLSERRYLVSIDI